MNETRDRGPGPDAGETFASTRALFQQWRESRQPGARIPKALWAAAVAMAREVGVAQTVRQLRVEGLQLVKRMEGTRPAPVPGPQPLTFVAWPKATPAAPVGTPECVITCQNAHGQPLRCACRVRGFSNWRRCARPSGGRHDRHHPADARAGGRRAGGLPGRHRRPGATLPGGPPRSNLRPQTLPIRSPQTFGSPAIVCGGDFDGTVGLIGFSGSILSMIGTRSELNRGPFCSLRAISLPIKCCLTVPPPFSKGFCITH